MPLSHDIALPRNHRPLFPRRCPGCGADEPADLIMVSRRRPRLFHLLLPVLLLFLTPVRVEVPACAACARRNRAQHRLHLAALIAGTVVALALVSPWMRQLGLSRGQRRLAVLGAVVVLLVPVFAWQVLAPPLVDITVRADSVVYEFADGSYAREFAALNRGVVE